MSTRAKTAPDLLAKPFAKARKIATRESKTRHLVTLYPDKKVPGAVGSVFVLKSSVGAT